MHHSTLPPLAVLALLTGRVGQLAPGRTSAIAKAPVEGPVTITLLGLDGDQQADLRVHGGPEKAIHHYPADHYAGWKAEGLPPHLLQAGGFGENISTLGWTEKDVCIGDRFRLGSALVEVSEGRQPCFKLNLRFGHPTLARRVQETGRSGWYYRVIEEGKAQAGDTLILTERPHPEWDLARVNEILFKRTLDRDALAQLAGLERLAPGWRRMFQRRLDSMQVEDWSARLGDGPA